MLTRAETTASDLTVNAAACTRYGAHGDWPRSSTSSGFVTLCPACAQANYQVYSGHLAGVLYASLSPKTRADAYLCCLCTQPRRAYYWDHCHKPGHGKVRGPLCAGCNTLEGGGWHYLQHPEAVPHLLNCTDCRRKNTLPARPPRHPRPRPPHPRPAQELHQQTPQRLRPNRTRRIRNDPPHLLPLPRRTDPLGATRTSRRSGPHHQGFPAEHIRRNLSEGPTRHREARQPTTRAAHRYPTSRINTSQNVALLHLQNQVANPHTRLHNPELA
ncbi:endonuclease domain-containing protein [Streptomyces sp. NBC_00147]